MDTYNIFKLKLCIFVKINARLICPFAHLYITVQLRCKNEKISKSKRTLQHMFIERKHLMKVIIPFCVKQYRAKTSSSVILCAAFRALTTFFAFFALA